MLLVVFSIKYFANLKFTDRFGCIHLIKPLLNTLIVMVGMQDMVRANPILLLLGPCLKLIYSQGPGISEPNKTSFT